MVLAIRVPTGISKLGLIDQYKSMRLDRPLSGSKAQMSAMGH
jgi:hypothetical protein